MASLKQGTRVAIVAVAICIAISLITSSGLASPERTMFYIVQSSGVNVTQGWVAFTHYDPPQGPCEGNVVGNTSAVCWGSYSTYIVECTDEPNDVKYHLHIDWSGACGDPTHKELWEGCGKWPGYYRVAHIHGAIHLEVEIHRMTVGGVALPTDKLGLIVPYFGFASAITLTTVGTAIYFKHVRRREDK